MSDTDKTRPWWVKAKEVPKEHHDHRNGICELKGSEPLYGYHRDSCYIDAAWWRPEFRCGCVMCDGSAYGYGPNQKNRKARRKWKKEADRDER